MRSEKLQLIQEEERLVENLFDNADAWYRSQRVRDYVDAAVRQVREAGGQTPEGFMSWMEWAKRQANRLDPLADSEPSILDEKAKWLGPYAPNRS